MKSDDNPADLLTKHLPTSASFILWGKGWMYMYKVHTLNHTIFVKFFVFVSEALPVGK